MSYIVEFEKAFSIWFGKGEEREEFSVDVSTDGYGLTISLDAACRQSLIEALSRKGIRDIELYFSKDDLILILGMLWDKGTIKAKPKFVWPLSFRKPKIELEIK